MWFAVVWGLKQCSVEPPSFVCCSFDITLHGVRSGMEHLKPSEPLLLSAAITETLENTKLRADSTKKRKRFKLPRCFFY